MANLIDGCAAGGARLVFADNLYEYGPQTRPLTEDMPLTNYGRKPAIRAEVTRLWKSAHDIGVCALSPSEHLISTDPMPQRRSFPLSVSPGS